jgi:hypothetical protein
VEDCISALFPLSCFYSVCCLPVLDGTLEDAYCTIPRWADNLLDNTCIKHGNHAQILDASPLQ